VADERKVKLTGEVDLKHGEMTAVVAELRAFNEGWKQSAELLQDLVQHLTGTKTQSQQAATAVNQVATAANKGAAATQAMAQQTQQAKVRAKELMAAEQRHAAILTALKNPKDAAAQKAMKAALDEMVALDKIRRQYQAVVNEALKVNDAVVKQEKETKKASLTAQALKGAWTGIWQGVGIGGVLSISGAVGGLIGWLKQGVVEGNKFDAIFDKMSARGVKGIDAIRASVVELAGTLGEDLVKVAESVDLAEKLGAGTEAVNVAKAAWQNYIVTGADVNNTISVSSRLIKAFNLDVSQQAALINDVAMSSQRARIDQNMLWQAMSMMGPMMKNLGANYRDLLQATEIGVSRGLKAEEEGLSGFRELLSQLISPSDQFAKNLVQIGLVATQNSDTWLKLTKEVEAQKKEFEALNEEIREYERESQRIGLLANEAERRITQYETLNKKRTDGERLTRRERKELRDLRDELKGYNKELKQYDEAGGLVANRDFRRLDQTEQLRQRLKSAAEAQADLNEKTARMKFEAEEMGHSLDAAEARLSPLAESLRTEIPAAIREAIGENGFGAFVQKLSEMPDVMAPLTAEVKTLVKTIGPGLGNAVTAGANQAGTAIAGIGGQFEAMNTGATNAMARLKTNFATIRTIVMEPVTNAMSAVAQLIMDKMGEPFGEGNQDLMGEIQAWAARTGATMLVDFDMFLNGDITLGQMLGKWFVAAGKLMGPFLVDTANAIIDGFFDALVEQITTKDPWAITSTLEGWFKPVTDFIYGNGLSDAVDSGFMGPAPLKSAAMMAPAPVPVVGSSRMMAPSAAAPAAGRSVNATFHNYGADVDALSNKIMRQMDSADRLGRVR